MAIQTDRELLGALSLSETQAADALDRTRQAVNAALRGDANRKKYFRPADILVLRLAAQGAGKIVDDEAVMDYVRRTHGQSAADRVRSGFGLFSGRLDLSIHKEVWVIVPDFTHVRSTAPVHAQTIRAVAFDFPQTQIVYFTGSPFQEAALSAFIEEAGEIDSDRVTFVSENLVGAQPTMLIADPRGHNPSVALLVPTGFTQTPFVPGGLISAYLSRNISELRNLPDLPSPQRARAAT